MSESMDKFAEIRDRWAKATPGPWEMVRLPGPGDCVAEIKLRAKGSTLWWLAELYEIPAGNIEAIMSAPEDVGWLIGEIERVRNLQNGNKQLIHNMEQLSVRVEYGSVIICQGEGGDPEYSATRIDIHSDQVDILCKWLQEAKDVSKQM